MRCESIHLREELIYSRISLTTSSVIENSHTFSISDSINFIYIYDWWCWFFGFSEELLYSFWTYSNVNFAKLRSIARKKGNSCLTCGCLCKSGFACPWRTIKNYAFSHSCSNFSKFFWVFHILNNLSQGLFGLLKSNNISKIDGLVWFGFSIHFSMIIWLK